jgi:hypothetical protein
VRRKQAAAVVPQVDPRVVLEALAVVRRLESFASTVAGIDPDPETVRSTRDLIFAVERFVHDMRTRGLISLV